LPVCTGHERPVCFEPKILKKIFVLQAKNSRRVREETMTSPRSRIPQEA
jgi:hypothetical protein